MDERFYENEIPSEVLFRVEFKFRGRLCTSDTFDTFEEALHWAWLAAEGDNMKYKINAEWRNAALIDQFRDPSKYETDPDTLKQN